MSNAPKTNDIGFGYLGKDKKGNDIVNLSINGRRLTAVKIENPASERHPDLRIIDFSSDEHNIVGNGWIGETKQKRTKLSLKIDGKFFTAVKRDKIEGQSDRRADYTVFGEA